MRASRWLFAASMVVISACGGPAASDVSGDDNQRAVTAVRLYLEALARRDLTGAMAQRCSAARFTGDRRTAFGVALDTLVDALDGLRPVSIAVVAQPAEVHPVADLPDPIVVRFNLEVAGRLTEQLLVTTVVEDGGRRVCGAATRDGYRLGGAAHGALTVSHHTVRSPKGLMPDDPAGLSRIAEHAIDPGGADAPAGLTDAWVRSWSDKGNLEADVVAYEFATGAEALAYAGLIIDSDSRTVVSRFEVADVTNAIGLRLLGQPSLWCQPADYGPQFDEIFVVYDKTLVISDVFQPDPRAGTELVTAIAASADALVGVDIPTS